MISILIVEDQRSIREVLEQILSKNSDWQVIGSLSSALEAIEFLKTQSPDIIILDVFLPKMNGLEFLAWLEKNCPVPVILFTIADSSKLDLEKFHIPIYYIAKSEGTEEDFVRMLNELIQAIQNIKKQKNKLLFNKSTVQSCNTTKSNQKIELIAIGASTGGTLAVETIVKNLPLGLPPIIIVQHMPEYFTGMLAGRLNQISKLKISEAKNGELMQNNHVYIAPGGIHCHVVYSSGNLYISLQDYEKVSSHKPSVDVLFTSIAESKIAPKTLAILLTGMGSDGAKGLLEIRKGGGITIGQDEKTSIVYGMPKVAYEMGGVMHQVALEDLPSMIIGLVKK